MFAAALALCFAVLALAVTSCTTPQPAALVAAAPNAPLDSIAAWRQMDIILARIQPPVFPARDFPITDYGAKPATSENARPAILAAIAACAASGGGRVVIPPGEFLCNGPIHLLSGVNLHISDRATLKFGGDPADYLPVVLTRWEGILVHNYSPLIYARGQKNIAITGKGTIDGGCENRSGLYKLVSKQGPDRDALWKMGAAQVPLEKRVFGAGRALRPAGIQPFECENILISGITITNMPFWCVHPVFSKNITIDNITVKSLVGNNDGVDPDSCSDVLIQNSHFETGDDAIVIKSGRDQDGWAVARPSENIIIRKNVFAGKLYGFAIGSEMSGGVRNIYVEDCEVRSGRAAIYTKANLDRGGIVENVFVRRIQIKTVSEAAIRFEANYWGHRGERHPSLFRNYIIEDVTCDTSKNYGIYIHGQPETPVTNVLLRNIKIHTAKKPFWIHHIKNIRLENVLINNQKSPPTPPLTPEGEEKLPIKS